MQGTSSDYPDRRRIQLAWFGSNRSATSLKLDDRQPTSARAKVCHKAPGTLPDQIDRCTSPSEPDRRIAERRPDRVPGPATRFYWTTRSITLLARFITDCGIVIPSDLPVFRLIANSSYRQGAFR